MDEQCYAGLGLKMIQLRRGDIVTINLNPTKGSETGKIKPCIVVTNDVYNRKVPVVQVVPVTEWTEKKGKILTNVVVVPDATNGLAKKSIADCLQTRPVDYRSRLVAAIGKLSITELQKTDSALKIIFDLK